ncbi:uncharacterized protein N7515_004822 [Penicillium bovifimosum]|uniref:Uncharacterized protein n=1 Tax=Penicillium bovifimosum TaxID=126998 RepID=A0A9W9H0V0_9EURO|nr:uncharacterized protein N7515_004822 [Penicillium bovifimosum]KAJ5135544.1 hypothetical protein N7515_004822 [Penicillium bovifimosum]
MPAPLAKGIIISVSVLIAAGIAVYESPQFKQWVNTSRRKIAVALHNLGDEIQPREIPLREDISMTEEAGEVAEERRRIARAEIMRRGTLLESRRKTNRPDQPHNSFDALVDKDGNLLKDTDAKYDAQLSQENIANSTGIDLGSGPLRRGGNHSEAESSTTVGIDRLHVGIPSSASSNHPSESLLQLTPTSEASEGHSLCDPLSPNSPPSTSGSSHTEDHQVFYAHPDAAGNATGEGDHQSQTNGSFDWDFYEESRPLSSTSGSGSLIGGSDAGKTDVTLSDFDGRTDGGVPTPANWSEIGSVVSDEDAGHI